MSGPELTPPGGAPAPSKPDNAAPNLTPPGTAVTAASGGTPSWVWLAAAALVLVAALVVLFLPDAVTNPSQDAPDQQASTPTTPTVAPSVQSKAKIQEPAPDLTDLYTRILKTQAALENENAPVWATAEWKRILELISSGEDAVGKGRTREAQGLYQQAIESLDALPESREARFEQAMELGLSALQDAEGVVAQNQFGIAVAAKPDSAEANTGLQRAQTIEEVVRLTLKAEADEENEQLESALSAYKQAAELDPLHEPAVAGVERVSEVLAAMAFRGHMTTLLNAIERRDLKSARAALKSARQTQGDSPELRDAERRIAAISLGFRLDNLNAQGRKQEKSEDWASAKKTYEQALKLDPANSAAQDGFNRSEELLALNQKMDHYLKRPELLQNADARKTVGNLLLIANAQLADKPKLQRKAQRLSTAKKNAGVTVKVTLVSDGLTRVTLYRVARLGTFSEHKLTLTPGRYTAVGARDGYRDVRVVFNVPASGDMPPVQIRCEERI